MCVSHLTVGKGIIFIFVFFESQASSVKLIIVKQTYNKIDDNKKCKGLRAQKYVKVELHP